MKRLSPEEKLLKAIFGEAGEEEPEHCEACGKVVASPIYYNRKPYHPTCLDKKVNGRRNSV